MIANPLELLLKYRVLSREELARMTGLELTALNEVIRENSEDLVIDGEFVKVKNPLSLAFKLSIKGFSLTRLAEYITWKDFEQFSAQILSSYSYETLTNLLLTKPVRLQIDVLGVDSVAKRAIAIDCKHWSRNTRSSLKQAAVNHYNRIVKLSRYVPYAVAKYPVLKHTRRVYGLIVTLLKPSVRVYENIVIVSINELNSFLRDIDIVLEELGLKPVIISL
ncbi:transcription antiterminator BglG [Thermogladius sp. 4427co]|uniref:transcription antiterminator BglG n=1 Tax=Thermogladius sp. 4427co TaxID=3450718 RepID=UPI003F7978A1